MITLASLFDGISGFPLAGQRNGMKAIWSSEIEPFPLKVSAIRFPDMKQVGDITKIDCSSLEPVDIITGGSPCQDLSVAGKRAGLAGERSGLFMEQIRIVRELREIDKSNGRTGNDIRPRFMVWENVPGAFSSNKGEDFRAVLEETARIADETVTIPRPPKDKWNTSGCIMGNGYSIAWRILDAQYWGVPQRRRRIFLVADFGGQSAPEILFKREGLSRHLAEGREAREGIAGDAERGVGKAIGFSGKNSATLNLCPSEELSPTLRSGAETHVMTSTFDFGRTSDRIEINPSVSVTLKGTGGGGGAKTGLYLIQSAGFCPEQSAKTRGIGYEEEISPTLRKDVTPAVAYGICSDASNSMKSSNPYSGIYEAETSRTLDQNGGSPACNQGGMAVVQSILPFDTTQITSPQNGNNPKYGDPCHPLCSTAHVPAIVEKQQINCQPSGIAGTVSSKWAKGTGGPAGDEHYNLVCAVDCRNMYENADLSGTLQSKENGGQSLNYQNPVRVGYSVRRLTPLECERLQDYPDGWTDITWQVTNKKGRVQTIRVKDSPRYKAAGNSVAVCCPEYVLEGIKEVLEAPNET